MLSAINYESSEHFTGKNGISNTQELIANLKTKLMLNTEVKVEVGETLSLRNGASFLDCLILTLNRI